MLLVGKLLNFKPAEVKRVARSAVAKERVQYDY
jgi:hypothetical protein